MFKVNNYQHNIIFFDFRISNFHLHSYVLHICFQKISVICTILGLLPLENLCSFHQFSSNAKFKLNFCSLNQTLLFAIFTMKIDSQSDLTLPYKPLTDPDINNIGCNVSLGRYNGL